MAFLDDIKSKHLGNFVLVTIGEHRISTRKITFDGDYYKPILLNIPSISESLDIENRKYKISSVSLSISDYMEDGERFSDHLNTLMNKEVVIWYASQSSKTLDDAECYKAGTYIVRSFSQNEDKVTLNCEDLSQDKLHKDLPLTELGDGDEIPDRYKKKPIPMVFGEVDRSPCVVSDNSILDEETKGNMIVISDTADSGVVPNGENPLLVFRDVYWEVFKNSLYDIGENSYQESFQYESFDNQFIIQSILNTYNNLNLISDNQAQVINKNRIEGITKFKKFGANEYFGDITDAYKMVDGDIGTFGVVSGHLFYVTFPDENINSPGSDDQTGFVDRNVIALYAKYPQLHISNLKSEVKTIYYPRIDVTASNLTGQSVVIRLFTGGRQYDTNPNSTSEIDAEIHLQNDIIPDRFSIIYDVDSAYGEIDLESKIYHLGVDTILNIDKFLESNFFGHVTGRGGATPTLQSIYSLVLSELGFDNDGVIDATSLGKYAFTIDKKISSKKLLEEISQSSGLFPYFKNGEFNVKSIKTSYSFGDTIAINVEDILIYKYDRTKIEKVYSKVNVKYHYDYGLKDFTKETGFIFPEQLESIVEGLTTYSSEYFNENFDQELVFESKYIRDTETAFNLAKYLCGLHANQHNLITLTLPLNYLTLELGDIVRLDKLIQGRKIFGEDYSSNSEADVGYDRNGQTIYNYWFITQIKKSLDKVEVKLYQLHKFDFTLGVVDIIEPDIPEEPDIPVLEYCPLPDYEETNVDENGTPVDWNNGEVNYVANTDLCVNQIEEVITDPLGYCLSDGIVMNNVTESECGGQWSLEPIIIGCMDESAVNTSDNATVSSESMCVFAEDLIPPLITSPQEDLVISIEEGESQDGLSDVEIITDINDSTFDDNTSDIVTITGTCTSHNTVFMNDSNDWYDVYPDNFFNGGTITNITTGTTGIIIGYLNNSYGSGSIRVQTSDFSGGWAIGDFYEINSAGINHSSYELIYSNNYNTNIVGGAGILKFIINTNNNIFGYGIKNGVNEWFSNLQNGLNYRLTFDLKSVEDVDFVFRSYLSGYSQYKTINTSWTTYEEDFTYTGSTNNNFKIFLIGGGDTHEGDIIEIDNISIKEIVLVTEPVLNVSWDKSENLIQTYPNLNGFTTAGEYMFTVWGIIDNNYVQFYAHAPIEATNQDSYSYIIYLNETNIPQNIPLILTLQTRSTSTYNGNYLLNGLAGFSSPTVFSEKSFSWGNIDPEQVYNVANIVRLVSYVMGEVELTDEEFQFADINGDNIVNVSDIVAIVNIIIYG